MVDYKKPIPKIEFLSNKLPVADPSDEPMVYMKPAAGFQPEHNVPQDCIRDGREGRSIAA